MRKFVRLIGGLLAILALMATAGRSASAGEKVLYSFRGGNDGEYPDTDLIVDRAGNLYGTTVEGGDSGSGTVFMLAPSSQGWTETVLYSFRGGADGSEPYGGVTLDGAGNLYGTTVVGGTGGTCVDSGCGVVFKLTRSGGTWTETVIHNFLGGNDGYGPGAGVTLGRNGALYGMTPTGGANGVGVIYELKPDQNGAWTEQVIHTFTGGADGATGSAGRLISDTAGNLYGVATVGGGNGDGTAFELAPTGSGKWQLNPLYAFKGSPDAGYPYGALVFDTAGNLYGTTYYDGANNLGSVYKLARADGQWIETVLYSFKGGTDGSGPISNLTFDANGNLYGTTSEGGASACGCGTVFRLTPGGNGSWAEGVVHRFTGPPDGASAYNGMVAGAAGVFYGATVHGGSDNEGAIFAFRP